MHVDHNARFRHPDDQFDPTQVDNLRAVASGLFFDAYATHFPLGRRNPDAVDLDVRQPIVEHGHIVGAMACTK